MASDKEIKIKFTVDTADSAKSVGDIRKAIKDLTSEAIRVGDEGGEGVDQLNQKIGELKEKINDLNETTNLYRGSGVERLKTSWSSLQDGFTNFNVDKVKAGFKAIGAAWKSIGIGLLISAVVYLIDNFNMLAEKFTFIGDIVKAVTDVFNNFTDAIGLTTNAIDKQTTNALEANQKQLKSTTEKYDNEIRLAKAAGKETVDQEIAKQKAIQETTRASVIALLTKEQLGGKLTEEEKKTLDELIKANKDAQTEILVIQATTAKKKEDAAKKNSDKAIEDGKKAKEAEFKNQQKANEENAKKAFDLETANLELAQAKELAAVGDNKEKIDEINQRYFDINRKRREDDTLFQLQQDKIEIENTTKKNKEKEDSSKKLQDEIDKLKPKSGDEEIEANAKKEKDKLQAIYDSSQKTLIDKQNLANGIEAIDVDSSAKRNAINLQNNVNQAQLDLLNNQTSLDAKKALLDTQMQQELSAIGLTETQKAIIKAKYRNEEEALEQAAFDKKIDNITRLGDAVGNGLSVVSSFQNIAQEESKNKLSEDQKDLDTLSQDYEKNADKYDEATKKKLESDIANKKIQIANDNAIAKKQFESNKKLQIAIAIVTGVNSVVSAYANGLKNPIFGLAIPTAIVQAGIAAAAAAANIAKIKATTFDSGGSGPTASGGGGGGSVPSGGGDTGGGFTPAALQKIGGSGKSGFEPPKKGKTDDEDKKEPQKIYVVSQDITNAQSADAILGRRASFGN